MRLHVPARLVLAGCLTFSLAACKALEDENPISVPTGAGAVTLLLDTGQPPTDQPTCQQTAPLPDGFRVDVLSIRTTGPEDDSGELLQAPVRDVDLVDFSAGAVPLAVVAVPNGTYDCVSIDVDLVAEIVSGGEVCAAAVPEKLRPLQPCLAGEVLEVSEEARTVVVSLPLCFAQCSPSVDLEIADGSVSLVSP